MDNAHRPAVLEAARQKAYEEKLADLLRSVLCGGDNSLEMRLMLAAGILEMVLEAHLRGADEY